MVPFLKLEKYYGGVSGIKMLLTGIFLGNIKPSQLLLKMKSLGWTNIMDKVLRTCGSINCQSQ